MLLCLHWRILGGCWTGILLTDGDGHMALRDQITARLKDAMREKDSPRVSTLRLINAAIKDQDIAARGKGETEGVDEAGVLAILGKMVNQRQESARA